MMINHGYENYEWMLFWICVVSIRFILPVSLFLWYAPTLFIKHACTTNSS